MASPFPKSLLIVLFIALSPMGWARTPVNDSGVVKMSAGFMYHFNYSSYMSATPTLMLTRDNMSVGMGVNINLHRYRKYEEDFRNYLGGNIMIQSCIVDCDRRINAHITANVGISRVYRTQATVFTQNNQVFEGERKETNLVWDFSPSVGLKFKLGNRLVFFFSLGITFSNYKSVVHFYYKDSKNLYRPDEGDSDTDEMEYGNVGVFYVINSGKRSSSKTYPRN